MRVSAKQWTFRLVAVAAPTLIGVWVLYNMLVQRHFIVADIPTQSVKLQRPMFLQEPGHEKTGHKYLFDTTLGWRNIPNWRATTHGKPLTINSKGLRGNEVELEKQAGVTRMLVLGDSFTWGYGVGDSEVFPQLLEDGLRLHHASAGDWEVLNAGVSGWGTDQEYLYFEREGIHYAPDVVIVAFFLMNDPVENVSARQYEMNKPVFLDLELTLGNVPVPKPHLSPWVGQRQDPIQMTLAILHAINKQCQIHGLPLVIMKFGRFLRPESKILLADEQVIASEVKSWEGVFYLDVDASFERQSLTTEELTIGNYDGHWNAHGHRVVANMLLRLLEDHEILSLSTTDEANATQ